MQNIQTLLRVTQQHTRTERFIKSSRGPKNSTMPVVGSEWMSFFPLLLHAKSPIQLGLGVL